MAGTMHGDAADVVLCQGAAYGNTLCAVMGASAWHTFCRLLFCLPGMSIPRYWVSC